MGSDDVRARAEAVALAYKNLRESISRWLGDGPAVSVNLGPLYESCDSLTAALAVAPATAHSERCLANRPDGGEIPTCKCPATGDAAAVRDACARLCESFKEHLWSGAAAPGTHAGSVATLLAGAIRRIPLPVPATAVEEARKAFYEAARAYSAAEAAAKSNNTGDVK